MGASVGASVGAPVGTAPGAGWVGAGAAVPAARQTDERSGGRSTLPWVVTAVALLGLVALVAGQRFGASRAASDEGQFAGGGAAPFGAAAGAVRAPDISSLSPRERADRLFDRVMRLSSEGKTDSVQFFAPMALSVYQSMGELDADLRYDYGRIAEASGAAEIARAQADSILRGDSTHLLGLVLAARSAQLRGDSAAARTFRRRLLAAEPAETTRDLPEYQRHRADILEALAEARRQ